jgi:hypothetical protein
MSTNRNRISIIAGVLAVAGSALPAIVASAALTGAAASASAQYDSEDAQVVQMKRQTLARLMKPITVDLKDHRLEDIVRFIADITQADINPFWIDDRSTVGLDKDSTVTVSVKNASALQLLELVLDKVSGTDGFDEASWQFTKYGNFEFGPKERLNRRKQVVFYDINDLLIEIPDYNNAPDFDLNAVFQQGGQQGGGGGSASPFTINQQPADPIDREAKVQEIIDLLITTVEPEQWVDNGGEAGTIRELRGTLFVNAPDYMHRQIFGYPWWPSRAQKTSYVKDRRYVTLDGSFDFSEIGLKPSPDVEGVP